MSVGREGKDDNVAWRSEHLQSRRVKEKKSCFDICCSNIKPTAIASASYDLISTELVGEHDAKSLYQSSSSLRNVITVINTLLHLGLEFCNF